MDEERKYYVYMYLREDGTPYYVGKGTGYRAYSKDRTIKPPKDLSRIIFHAQNLTEEEAFAIEIEQIKKYGRVNNNTGILRNLTDGGEGSSGNIVSEETRAKLSANIKKAYANPEVRAKRSASAKEVNNRPEVKAKIGAASKEVWNRPEVRAKMIAASKEINNRPEVKAKFTKMMHSPEMRAKRIAATNTPEANAKRSATLKKACANPEVRAKMSAAAKEAMNRPEVKAKLIAAAKKRALREQAEKLAAQANLQSFLEEPSTQLDTVV